MQRTCLITALICSILFLVPVNVNASSDFTVLINNKQLSIKSPTPQPQLIQSRVYVPLRVISEQLGVGVEWDKSNQQVLLTRPGKTSVTPPSRSTGERGIRIVVDGGPLTIPADLGCPFIKPPGYTMIPLRAVALALDCDVNWDNTKRLVTVNNKAAETTPSTPEVPQQETPVVVNPNPVTPTTQPETGASSLLNELAAYTTNLKLLDGQVINSAALKGRSESEYTAQQIQQFNKLLEEIKKYPLTYTLPAGTVGNTYNVTIMGSSTATADQLQKWAQANATRIQQAKNMPLTPIPNLAAIYLRIGAEYGLRGDLAYCQAAKETGYWQFTGQVKAEQNNYCGLYAIGSPLTGNESLGGADPNLVSFKAGTHGAWFATPEAGVEAQIQHLYGYATSKPLPAGKVILDPRYKLINKGIAPTWTALNARWAVPGTTYGQSIVHDYWLKALQY